MKKLFGALAAAALLFVESPASALDIGNDGFIEVEGVEYPSPGENLNDARRLAILDAYRQLGESVGDLHISSESTIKQKLEKKSGKSKSERVVTDELNTKVNAVVTGALLKSAYRDSDGSFHAIVRLSVFGGAKRGFSQAEIYKCRSQLYRLDCRLQRLGLVDGNPAFNQSRRRHRNLRLQKYFAADGGGARNGKLQRQPRDGSSARGQQSAHRQGDVCVGRMRCRCQ